VSSPEPGGLIFGCCCFRCFGRGCAVCVGAWGGGARGGGQACGLPLMLPARGRGGSQVQGAAQRHRVSDAAGALDLGGTAPQAARRHRRHPRTQHQRCSGREREGGVLLGGCWGGVGWHAPGRFPGCGQARCGVVGHPFAARGRHGVLRQVRSVGVNQRGRLARGWGS
jgi:hypothetical protein